MREACSRECLSESSWSSLFAHFRLACVALPLSSSQGSCCERGGRQRKGDGVKEGVGGRGRGVEGTLLRPLLRHVERRSTDRSVLSASVASLLHSGAKRDNNGQLHIGQFVFCL